MHVPVTVLNDFVQPFQVESMAAQGRLVRLGPALQRILSAHQYPSIVAKHLGELVVVGAILSGTLKRKGVLTVQAIGEGAIRLLVVDVTQDGNVRGYARFDESGVAALVAQQQDELPLSELLPSGRLVFNLKYSDSSSPYQGIVPLEGTSLAESARAYFLQSVQSETAFKITVALDEGVWSGGGLMVQRLAKKGFQFQSGENGILDHNEAWNRAVIMMESCTDIELLNQNVSPTDLLFRLFHQDGVRVFPIEALQMLCRCSKGRVEEVLGSFPKNEIEEMKIDGQVLVNCEFCNETYRFGPGEIDQICQVAGP